MRRDKFLIGSSMADGVTVMEWILGLLFKHTWTPVQTIFWMSRLCCMRLLSCALFLSLASALGADLAGTWLFSVDLDSGGHGTPTFVFEQKGEILNGSYKGPLGDRTLTGKVTGDEASFSFEFTQNGQPLK